MNKDLKRILMVVYILALIAMITGATFAYFAIIKVSNVTPRVEATTAQTDWLIFDAGAPINISATEENFGENMGNLAEETFASASLRVSNTELESVYQYNLSLEISDNNFEYTTVEETAELLLTITDPNGNPVTNIAGLEYVKVGDVSGFDITTKTGSYQIANAYEIRTYTQAEHIWNVTVTFVNLNSDQEANTGKSLAGHLTIEPVDLRGV